jgi:hypothetical protein
MASTNEQLIIPSNQDQSYFIHILLIFAVVYTVYISPVYQTMAIKENNLRKKSMYRWVDFLTKILFVFVISYTGTNNPLISIVITLVFILFLIKGTQRIVIETKNRNKMIDHKMVDNIRSSNDEMIYLDESDDFNKGDDSNQPFGILELEFSDENGEKYVCPQISEKVNGLITDTIAESEAEAVKQGLGNSVTTDQNNIKYNSMGEEITSKNNISVENFGNEFENMKNTKKVSEKVNLPKEVEESLEEPIESVAKEVIKEKKKEGNKVKVTEEKKEEVRKAVKYVVYNMEKDGKTATNHDILMICRMVYGQMFKCKKLLNIVVKDAGYDTDNDSK